ncbi:MAG: flagellar FlbD family protein [Planctomycetes bacterium]|nr:flagellar FlbD family protein [Planctomycetota bacterium]
MIQLTRLNGRMFVLNSELIKFVEQTPDTLITLLTGDKVLVTESLEEVTRKWIEYRRNLRFFDTGQIAQAVN